MSTLTAATWVAAFLLVLAGARKVMQPASAGSALRTAQLPSDLRLVRMLGGGEATLGLTVLTFGGAVPIALQAMAYGAFAVFAQRQRRDGTDCGCFGTTGTPVTAVHVWLDAIVAATGLAAAFVTVPGLTTVASRQPLAALVAAALVVVAANLLRLLLTSAPQLTAAIALLEPDGTA